MRRASRPLSVEPLEDRRLLSYTITDLGSFGGTFGNPLDINARGQVVGYSYTANDAAGHAFLYAHGTLTDLGTHGGTFSESMGINDTGVVVGLSEVAPGSTRVDFFRSLHGRMTDLGVFNPNLSPSDDVKINDSGDIIGFELSNGDASLDRRGKMIDLGSLTGLSSVARALNNSDEVVGLSGTGSSSNPTATYHAFLYRDGKMIDLGTLGGNDSEANDINDRGEVVGLSVLASETAQQAFLYSHGRMTDLGTLGGADSEAGAINNHGVVVGAAETINNLNHAFVDSDGKMTDLNTLVPSNSGYMIVNAQDINDRGQIVAQAIEANSSSTTVHVLLLNPTKHPG
jgi:probable HAF family extracellular repeat protein